MEQRFRDEANKAGLPVEQLAARRLEEADLLWQIHSAAPESETRRLHRLLRKKKTGKLAQPEEAELTELLDERESRSARRLHDLSRLSQLSGMPLPILMDRLGITPINAP
jgi:hypothetical protein